MKFSIGIPAYKAKYLGACICSILAQVYKEYELIIVNDDSPEDIDTIVTGFKDNRIRYYKNKLNFGAENVVDNWNKCLSHAKGEYFVLMGDDDQMEPNYLEEFLNLIERFPGLDIYHCRSYVINCDGLKIGITPGWPEHESVYENIWHRISSYRLQFISDFVYKRDALVKKGGFYKMPLAWASDDITSYIAMKDKGIAHTNKAIFNYRINELTISSKGCVSLKLKAIQQEKEWLESFLKNRPSKYLDKLHHELINKSLLRFVRKKIINSISIFYENFSLKVFLELLLSKREIKVEFTALLFAFAIFLRRR
jgi:glycosyltransferase involved in cell wall biosynthesis